MSQFIGLMRHEYKMAVKRPGMWIAYGVLYLFFAVTVFMPDELGKGFPAFREEMWQYAAYSLLYVNMFMVLLGGILAADRLQRDYRLGVRELQQSSPIGSGKYLLAKYLGVLCAVSLPMVLYVMVWSLVNVVYGSPTVYPLVMLVTFLVMGVPAYAFVVAFSLACPLFMPVRVYQVLFVGYWFWGNYLSPDVFPTISHTLLVPSGKFALHGFFGGFPSVYTNYEVVNVTTVDAVLNLIILVIIPVLVLILANQYLNRQARCL